MLWEVVQGLGVFSIAAGVFAYVGRYAIDQYFEKSLDKYRMELDKERLKFSDLHTTRAEITAELYEKFVAFEDDMRALTGPDQPDGPSREEKIRQAARSGNNFSDFYSRNKIYFPPRICDSVEELNDELREIYIESKTDFESRHEKESSERFGDQLALWKRVTEEDIPELKTELETHFRELLGVELED
jgi:hypothetical protein